MTEVAKVMSKMLNDVQCRTPYGEFYSAIKERGHTKVAVAIEKVIFNPPATIVLWTDGTKTVVKAENEEFDKEKGLAMAICKRTSGNKGNYFEVFKKYCHNEPESESFGSKLGSLEKVCKNRFCPVLNSMYKCFYGTGDKKKEAKD